MLTTDADGPSNILSVEKRFPVNAGPNVQVLYCKRVSRDSVSPSLIRALLPYIRWADLVHLTAVYCFPTFPTLFACRLLRKPLVWSPRGALQRWKDTRRRRLKTLWESACSIVPPRATMLHVTSEAERIDSSRRLPRLRTALIPNGVEAPRQATHVPGDANLRLAYLGRLEPKKGLENLLLASRILRDTGLVFSLTIGGGGAALYVAELQALAATLGVDSNVTFVGPISRRDKGEFFAKADAIVVPSHIENFCAVVAEALAHEVPVIASRGTPWARIEEVACGLWVENDPKSLACAVQQIARMPMREMGQRGRRWMIEEYSWSVVAHRMLDLYGSLVIDDVVPTLTAQCANLSAPNSRNVI